MSQAPAQREEPSMEDILSSIRKIIQSNDDGDANGSETASAEVASEPVQPEPEIQEAPAAPVQSSVQAAVSDEGELTAAPERAREVVSEKAAPAPEPEIIEPVSKVETPQAQPSANSALISAGSQAKVAASFAQLNDAITASSSQSLEEMTNDLLKPMLQEWLDNNLPGLVEKLVREEIERVARGGHES